MPQGLSARKTLFVTQQHQLGYRPTTQVSNGRSSAPITKIPISNTNQPKPVRNVLAGILAARRAPKSEPPIARAVKARVTGQLMLTAKTCPPRAAAFFITIVSSEVPMARCIDNPANTTRAGTIRNPPPAPTNPVTAPTPAPMSKETHSLRSEEHTSELQSRGHLVCRLLLAKKN